MIAVNLFVGLLFFMVWLGGAFQVVEVLRRDPVTEYDGWIGRVVCAIVAVLWPVWLGVVLVDMVEEYDRRVPGLVPVKKDKVDD